MLSGLPILFATLGCAWLPQSAQPEPHQTISLAVDDQTENGAADNRAQVSPQLDLWPVLLDEFSLGQCDEGHAEVARWARFYADHQPLTERILQRAANWLVYIHAQTQRRHLPGEIVFLPAIESAFQAYAFSHGRAAGLWQFVPRTARHYGLSINWWYDARRDVRAATPAALEYLKQLGKRFQGNWMLALAAYNSGASRVAREARHAKKPLADLLPWQLHLPRETRSYVPKLLGFACLMQTPARFDWQRPPLLAVQRWRRVHVEGQIDLPLAAELAGVSTTDLRALNPGLNRWATPPGQAFDLLLPGGKVARLRTALAKYPASERIRWQRYRVRRGDNLKHLARHFRIRVADIQRSNGLGDSSHIRAGDYLLIPHIPAGRPQALDRALARLDFAGGRLEHDRLHTAVRGDSLWRIARRYHVSVAQLRAWNQLGGSDTIRVGQDLVVQPALDVAGIRIAANQHRRRLTYRVRRGDSLWAIAHKFGIGSEQLSRWNDLDQTHVLHPGQSLRLQVDVTRQGLR